MVPVFVHINTFLSVNCLFYPLLCRLDLLPFYARLVATLHPCMSDVAEDLCSMLKGDFRFHVCSGGLDFTFRLTNLIGEKNNILCCVDNTSKIQCIFFCQLSSSRRNKFL